MNHTARLLGHEKRYKGEADFSYQFLFQLHNPIL